MIFITLNNFTDNILKELIKEDLWGLNLGVHIIDKPIYKAYYGCNLLIQLFNSNIDGIIMLQYQYKDDVDIDFNKKVEEILRHYYYNILSRCLRYYKPNINYNIECNKKRKLEDDI